MPTISADTLHPAHCEVQPRLPQLMRLGHIQDLGAPVLMPAPYGHSVWLRSAPGQHDRVLAIAEAWALQFVLQAPQRQLELYVFDTGLATRLEVLERLAAAIQTQGLPPAVRFVTTPGEFRLLLEQWQADARERKSRLSATQAAQWIDPHSAQPLSAPLRMVLVTDLQALDDPERYLAPLVPLVQQGPRLGYWFWLVGSGDTPTGVQGNIQQERWGQWFAQLTHQLLCFAWNAKGNLQLPKPWAESLPMRTYAELGVLEPEPLTAEVSDQVVARYIAQRQPQTTQASTEADFWSVPIGQYQGQPFSLRMGPRNLAYHGLLAATIGRGKSALLKLMIARSCERYTPDQLQFALFDLSGVGAFGLFDGLPHIHTSYENGTEFAPMVEALAALFAECAARGEAFKTIARKGLVQNITQYNREAEKQGKPRMPCIVVVVDEAHKLSRDPRVEDGSFTLKAKVGEIIEAIAREGRKTGVMLLLCSQTFADRQLSMPAISQCRMRISPGLTSELDCRTFFGSDNLTALNLPPWHTLINDAEGSNAANRVVALDHMDDETIDHHMQALRERYAQPSGTAQGAP